MVKPKHLSTIALPLLLLVSGCQREPTRIELPEDEIIVLSMLEAGADTVRMLLLRGGYDQRSGTPQIEPIVGAEPELSRDGQRALLEPAPRGVLCVAAHPGFVVGGEPAQEGCYVAALPGGVRAAARYGLRALLPDGAVVTGGAKVPEPPEVLTPEPGERVPAEWATSALQATRPVTIRWRSRGGTASVGLVAVVTGVFIGGEAQEWHGCRVAGSGSALFPPDRETAQWRLWIFGCVPDVSPGAAPADSIEVELRVIANDAAFTRYIEAGFGRSIRRSDVSANLEGAVGLFGAMASEARRVMLYRIETTGPPED